MLTENIELHSHQSKPSSISYIKRTLTIRGPSGRLELSIAHPKNPENPRAIAIICHPHPLFGGTMDNKVVHQVANTLNDAGIATVRFNFRGIGRSEGNYAEGFGETEDLLTVVNWVRTQRPHTPLWLAGFSFGAYVALRAWPECLPENLITIAPPVNFFDFKNLPTPAQSWLVIQGDQDEIVPAADVLNWLGTLEFPPQVACLKGSGHFFHGQLNHLSEVLNNYLLNEASLLMNSELEIPQPRLKRTGT